MTTCAGEQGNSECPSWSEKVHTAARQSGRELHSYRSRGSQSQLLWPEPDPRPSLGWYSAPASRTTDVRGIPARQDLPADFRSQMLLRRKPNPRAISRFCVSDLELRTT